MWIKQSQWMQDTGWSIPVNEAQALQANLVLAFGGRNAIARNGCFEELQSSYPGAHILLCSTSGEIVRDQVFEDTVAVTAIRFERTELHVRSSVIPSIDASYDAGKALAEAFPAEGLVHLFVISDGQQINGSELVRGLNDGTAAGVSISGGLAGDGARFSRTLVGLNGQPAERQIAAVGFYGKHLAVRCSSFGGWDSFGLDRLITRSEKNILYELDGQPALDLYKRYLGDQAAGLPGTALLFPLSIRMENSEEHVVRTILSIDEESRSMVFAGDMPAGSYARLMKANFERLIDGASQAAANTLAASGAEPVELAILISCVGRKLVLGQRIEEEIERVREVFGRGAILSGFYSYGEISPHTSSAPCELHNQTMTITTFSERQPCE